jgi:hypothetical protein
MVLLDNQALIRDQMTYLVKRRVPAVVFPVEPEPEPVNRRFFV